MADDLHEDDAPAVRKRPRPGERRVQILRMLATMLEQGDERITTAALAARLGVSEAALYRHFASKAQMYEGLIIAINNRGLGKSFTLRRTVQGIGVEQIFLLNSPKIVSIVKKQSSKVRRAKLYFIRSLRGKSARLKAKL